MACFASNSHGVIWSMICANGWECIIRNSPYVDPLTLCLILGKYRLISHNDSGTTLNGILSSESEENQGRNATELSISVSLFMICWSCVRRVSTLLFGGKLIRISYRAPSSSRWIVGFNNSWYVTWLLVITLEFVSLSSFVWFGCMILAWWM